LRISNRSKYRGKKKKQERNISQKKTERRQREGEKKENKHLQKIIE